MLLVVLGIGASYAIGRALGLPHKLAVLVACGNSICGNSAIAAVAPVIGAEREHVASSIAFTAILGVVVVVGLPLLDPPARLATTSTACWPGSPSTRCRRCWPRRSR